MERQGLPKAQLGIVGDVVKEWQLHASISKTIVAAALLTARRCVRSLLRLG